MTNVLRVTAADRERWSAPGERRGNSRSREARWLAASLAVVLLGLWLTMGALGRSFAEIEQDLDAGRILNLALLTQPEELRPFLPMFTDPSERAFVAERMWQDLTRDDRDEVDNVGSLAALRVSAADIEDEVLPVVSTRLEVAQGHGAPGDEPSVRLLSDAQLRELKPRFVVRSPARFRLLVWLWVGGVMLVFGAVHVYWRWTRFRGDQLLLPLLASLSGLGLLAMASIWDPLRDTLYVVRSAQGVIVGCVLLAVVSRFDFGHRRFQRLAFPALLAAFVLATLLVLFGTGPGSSDARVNLFGVQPVEAIKILVVFFLAGYFADRWEMLRELREQRGWFGRLQRRLPIPKLEYVLPPMVAMLVLLGFFFLQRDLGPALIMSLLFLSLYGVARGRPTMALVGWLVMVAGFAVGYQLGFPRTVTRRIDMWLSPWESFFAGGDHLAQSLWATATGGWTGTGLGLGQPGFVPAVHTDMVLTALGEELGFVGLLAIFGLYGLLVWRGLGISIRAAGVFSFFLALGLTLLMAWQVALISCGVFGLLPLSGVVTPFLSYGRSAMLANFAILGVLASISSRSVDLESHRPFRGATRWVAVVLTLVLGAVVFRLGHLQVIADERVMTEATLALQADGVRRFRYNPRLLEVARQIDRGRIVDRNGVPLAVNAGEPLSEEVLELYSQLGVASEPPIETGAGRFYPFAGRTFHLLGDLNTRVNWAASNTSFVERDERVRLQGYDDHAEPRSVLQPGGERVTLVKRDYRELVPLLRYQHWPSHPEVRRILDRNRDVQISMDVRLQMRVGTALARRAQEAEGRGAAVVLDVDTGELLASVSLPWPQRQPVTPGAGAARLIDRPRYGIYPPGSTFKVLTAMAALRKDPNLADQTFICRSLDGGRVGNRVRGWGRPIRDDPTVRTPHGEVDLEKGIRVSCNAYFAQLATYEIGPSELLQTAALADITVARPNTVEELQDALPQAAYGQGQVIATPLEMARVAAAVAGDGVLPRVRWVLEEAAPSKTEEGIPIISPPQAELLAAAMRQVVLAGSGRRLREVLPPIAGKTGTAEVEGKRSHSWFIGFAPAGAPSGMIAFAVLLENAGYGGEAAAEVAEVIVRESQALGYFE